MDGLLVDSMQHWLDMDREWFGTRNIELTQELITYFTGRSLLENLTYLKEKFNLEDTIDMLEQERTSWQNEIYTIRSKVMPGAGAILQTMFQKNIKQAIASGAPTKALDIVVDRFGWRNYFEVLVSSDHVNCVGKPDPEIFLHTANKLGINPEECVVFEDAENGVVAAKRAGMACIAVPDSRWSFGDFSQADLVVDSLEDKKIYHYLNV